MLMRGLPHAARCSTGSPATRALWAAASGIRRMSGEESSPPLRQTRQLTARQGQQRLIISASHQLLEHVQPLPHRLLEHPAQNLVHLATFLSSRRSSTDKVRDTEGP
jgi:hypothetical protein